jgi:hypothetical protein
MVCITGPQTPATACQANSAALHMNVLHAKSEQHIINARQDINRTHHSPSYSGPDHVPAAAAATAAGAAAGAAAA